MTSINLVGERASLLDAAAFWLDSMAFWSAVGPDMRREAAQSAIRYASKITQLGELRDQVLGIPPTWLGARAAVARAKREERARAAEQLGMGANEPEAMADCDTMTADEKEAAIAREESK